MAYYGDDEYDYERRARHERRPSPHRYQSSRTQQYLNPNLDPGGLYRTRSQGHAPAPIVNVYNDVAADAYQRSSPPRSPSPYAPYAPYPPSPEFRGRRERSLGEELLAEELAEMRLERRIRSRSRGRSDATFRDGRDEYLMEELRRKERDMEERERKASRERDRERFEAEFKAKQLQADQKKAEDAKAAKDREKRAIEEYELRKREEEEEKKAEEKRIREKIEREKVEAKEKKERERKELIRELQEEKEKKEKEAKEEQEKVDEALRKRFFAMGYTAMQVERLMSDEKNKSTKTTTTTTTLTTKALELARPPTYIKVHTDYLSIETLKYYGIPYEYDRLDKEYIIILRELSKEATDELFDHTKRLRQKRLLLEPKKKEPQYAWVRKRSKSRHGRDKSAARVSIVKFDD